MTETVELPIHTLPDGRKFLTDEQVRLHGTADFVQRFSNYWTRDDLRNGWIGPARGGGDD